MLRDALSELEEHVSSHGNLEDIPNEAIYEDFLQIAEDIISTAAYIAKTLKTMSEEIDLPEPDRIAGVRLKPRLAFTHTEKNEIVYLTLVSARQILRSHFDTVHPLAKKIAYKGFVKHLAFCIDASVLAEFNASNIPSDSTNVTFKTYSAL